jgi:hypothetical protein
MPHCVDIPENCNLQITAARTEMSLVLNGENACFKLQANIVGTSHILSFWFKNISENGSASSDRGTGSRSTLLRSMYLMPEEQEAFGTSYFFNQNNRLLQNGRSMSLN